MAAIELKDVERRYGERVALSGVSASVDEGETLTVLGPNGAGKTTLLKVLATLLRPHGGQRSGARRRAARRGLEGARAGGPAGPRAAALPRPQRAREPALPRAAAPGSPRARGGGARRPWGSRAAPTSRCASSRAGWSSGWPQRGPCCTTRRCCCSTSRAPAWTPRRRSCWSRSLARPSGRTRVLVTHDAEQGRAEADHVLELEEGGPRDPLRLGDPAQGPAPGGPDQGVGAGDAAVQRHRLRAVPLRPGPRLAGRRAGQRRAVGDPPAGQRDRGHPPVRRRARAGRDRGPAALPRGPHRPVRGQGGRAVRLPVPGGAGGGARLLAAPAGPGLQPELLRSCCWPTSGWRASARWCRRWPARAARGSWWCR